MSKDPTKPGDENPDPRIPIDNSAGPGAPTLAATVDPSPTAIRAATTDSDEPSDPAPSIPALLERVGELESALAALLDDLAVALPDLRAPAPIPSTAPSPSGAYALQPAPAALDTLRERATTGDRAALMRYLRLRRS